MADCRLQIAEFCRDIESYLCKKNDGHLIRVVGPSFVVVSSWAERGVPLKVAYAGIDRYFDRYYRAGPRRRPVRIEFCEDDVLDVFDEWRRATGIRSRSADDERSPGREDVSADHPDLSKATSLPAHLKRVVTRLSSARASGTIGPEFDQFIDRLSSELDAARSKPAGLRGAARTALVTRLEDADRLMMDTALGAIRGIDLDAIHADADAELAPFRDRMNADEYARARERAISNLVRERLRLPILRLP